LRIHPLDHEISEIRCWCEGRLTDVHKVKLPNSKMCTFEV
jgi:hypothetical protein